MPKIRRLYQGLRLGRITFGFLPFSWYMYKLSRVFMVQKGALTVVPITAASEDAQNAFSALGSSLYLSLVLVQPYLRLEKTAHTYRRMSCSRCLLL